MGKPINPMARKRLPIPLPIPNIPETVIPETVLPMSQTGADLGIETPNIADPDDGEDFELSAADPIEIDPDEVTYADSALQRSFKRLKRLFTSRDRKAA